MSRLVIVLSICLVGLTALAQPGLCPCWLMMDINSYHPHLDRHPDRPHSHDYLGDLFNAGVPALVPFAHLTAHSLIALLALGVLWRLAMDAVIAASEWISALEPPPPRQAPSFSICSVT
jgi:hypothetical protein